MWLLGTKSGLMVCINTYLSGSRCGIASGPDKQERSGWSFLRRRRSRICVFRGLVGILFWFVLCSLFWWCWSQILWQYSFVQLFGETVTLTKLNYDSSKCLHGIIWCSALLLPWCLSSTDVCWLQSYKYFKIPENEIQYFLPNMHRELTI